MVRIAQEHPDGCGIATLAMLLDVPYGEALALLRVPYGQNAVVDVAMDAALVERGFAVQRRYRYDPLTGAPRPHWPPPAWAPAHYALVRVAAGYHAVAVDARGRVLDPWKAERASLTHPDYLAVDQVVGVWPVAHRPADPPEPVR